ncbi:Uncharacterized conserved protein UCP009193 [Abeliophyllum distichum]|uniref:Uncharacterized conserved protein UCP009193 n=1 Tax=Abeliophyllum distichum TaxID=126358 RepID=A0ABD1Q1N9_9LAMI
MDITVVDENDKGLFTIFQNAANTLSLLYTQAVNQHKAAFEAGQKYSLVKLHEWMVEKQQEGKIITVAEIYDYLQGELNGHMPDVGMQGPNQIGASPRLQPEVASSSSAPITQQSRNSYQDQQMEIPSGGTMD